MAQFRKIKNIIPAIREDIADLETYRAMPTRHLEMIDPFLFLNHHGRQIYLPHNQGLPFGPHPHRGFETVTFILEGDIAHKDSSQNESVIKSGGIQWMTAGRGLIHSETSSLEFKTLGGPLEILQLWINLPSKLKMTTPKYVGLQRDSIPVLVEDHGRVRISIASGEVNGLKGAFENHIDVVALLIEMDSQGQFEIEIPSERNIFFYQISGSQEVNGMKLHKRHSIQFTNEGQLLKLLALENSKILLCHALPIGEPVASYGPFVMNTREEINQAIKDYQAGKF